jgi:hypothetical protein
MGAVTVNVAEPMIPIVEAVIVTLPCATPVANPLMLTVAVDVDEDVQVTALVRFCMLPLLYVPVAVNC